MEFFMLTIKLNILYKMISSPKILFYLNSDDSKWNVAYINYCGISFGSSLFAKVLIYGSPGVVYKGLSGKKPSSCKLSMVKYNV